MANEATVDQQQLQSTFNTIWTEAEKIIARMRDVQLAALNTIDVSENQRLGLLAAADDLLTAPMDDPAAFRERLLLKKVLGSLAVFDTLAEAKVGDAAAVRQALELGVAATGDASTVRQALELGIAATGDAAVVRQALGLGDAARRNVGTSIGDLIGVGQYGLGERIALTSDDNLDDIVTPGFYGQETNSATAGNNYPEERAGALLVMSPRPLEGNPDYGMAMQLYISYGFQGRVFFRNYYAVDGQWAPWRSLYSSGDDSGWISATLRNGWENYGGSYSTPAFYKDAMGWVHLKGLVQNGSGSTIFVLPAGYRPGSNMFAPISVGGDGRVSRLDIDPSGNVVMRWLASADYAEISGFPAFLAEN